MLCNVKKAGCKQTRVDPVLHCPLLANSELFSHYATLKLSGDKYANYKANINSNVQIS